MKATALGGEEERRRVHPLWESGAEEERHSHVHA